MQCKRFMRSFSAHARKRRSGKYFVHSYGRAYVNYVGTAGREHSDYRSSRTFQEELTWLLKF